MNYEYKNEVSRYVAVTRQFIYGYGICGLIKK